MGDRAEVAVEGCHVSVVCVVLAGWCVGVCVGRAREVCDGGVVVVVLVCACVCVCVFMCVLVCVLVCVCLDGVEEVREEGG